MTATQIDQARQIIKDKPYLLWYVSDLNSINLRTIVESVLNYGDWDDFKKLVNILGIKQTHEIFKEVIGYKRKNLKPRTINYFQRYFNKYAY